MIDATDKAAPNSQPFDVIRVRVKYWGPTADVAREIEASKERN